MTVVAWDGTTLAADKRASGGAQLFTLTKAYRVNGYLVGVAGAGDKIGEFVAWVANGMDVTKYPKNEEASGSFSAMVITPEGEIRQYERTPYPMVVEEPMHTIGSGRDLALAAMAFGKTAAEAVEFAARFDDGCGNGVTALRLRD